MDDRGSVDCPISVFGAKDDKQVPDEEVCMADAMHRVRVCVHHSRYCTSVLTSSLLLYRRHHAHTRTGAAVGAGY